MGRGLSQIQKDLLVYAVRHPDVPSFPEACRYFTKGLEYSDMPAVHLTGFIRCPAARKILSIRASICRSLRRLEERGLIQRDGGLFVATLYGVMLVETELTVNRVPLTDRVLQSNRSGCDDVQDPQATQ